MFYADLRCLRLINLVYDIFDFSLVHVRESQDLIHGLLKIRHTTVKKVNLMRTVTFLFH